MKLRMIAIVLMLPIMINLLVFSSTDIVVEAQTIRVTGVELSEDRFFFDYIGQEQTMFATIMPIHATDRTVFFEIYDEEIATVSATGQITSVSNGSTTVSVTTRDGNFVALASVIVESFAIEEFEARLVEGETRLYQEQYAIIEVVVAPIQAMASDLDMRVNAVDIDGDIEAPSILELSPFEIYNEDRRSITFRATITAVRVGEQTVTIFFTSAQTGHEVARTITFEVLPDDGGPLGIVFNGRTYSEYRNLITITNRIELNPNRNNPGTYFTLMGENDIATITNTENVDQQNTLKLVFSEAGTVNLRIASDVEGDVGYVLITSTYGRICDDMRGELNNLDDLNLFFGRRQAVRLEIFPEDFLRYYSVEWTIPTGSGLTLMRHSSIHHTIEANRITTQKQVVTINFTHRTNENESFSVTFYVRIKTLGVNQIHLQLNTPTESMRGLEQTRLFGNQRYDGENFEHQLIFTSTGDQGAQRIFDFSSDSTLASVNSTGLVTFNSDFLDFNTNGRAFVTITITSRYPTFNGDFASASFTFEVVNAANVSNFNQYNVANNANRDIVLQNTINFGAPITTQVSLFGNGNLMNASVVADATTESNVIFFTFRNNANFHNNNATMISNVVFAGFSDSVEVEGFEPLQSRGTLVSINANTTLQYSVLERAAFLLNISGSFGRYGNRNILVRSNLFRDAGTAAALMGDSNDYYAQTATNIVFEDLIFERSLTGILFVPGQESDTFNRFEFTIRGSLLFYTWVELNTILDLRPSIVLMGVEMFLRLDTFGINNIVKTDQYNVEFVQLAIVRLEAPNVNVAGNDLNVICRVIFEPNTSDRINDFFDTDVLIGIINVPAGITTLSIPSRKTIHNINNYSQDFISIQMQQEHFTNPDYSLIIRQICTNGGN